MKNITMIAAVGKNNELGKNNDLIWRIKEDLQFFKENTMGKPIAMGYNTFMSLRGGKPLPGRHHIILTSKEIEKNEQITIVRTIDELLKYIENYKDEVMIIGGASVYNQMIKYADKLLLTEINESDSEADCYFPTFNKNEWEKELIKEYKDNEISYSHVLYKRK